mgnify:CR=1 FL=1
MCIRDRSIDEIMNIDEAIGSRLYEMSCGYVASFSGRRLNSVSYTHLTLPTSDLV